MKNLIRFAASCLGAATLAGCTGLNTYEPIVQSRFIYPNSNVYDTITKDGHAHRVSFFTMPSLNDADLVNEAIADALHKAGPEYSVLTDAKYTAAVKMIPFLPIYIVDATIVGNASKVEIGERSKQTKTANATLQTIPQ